MVMSRGRGRPRDSQRSKLYSAEWPLKDADHGPGALPSPCPLPVLQSYVDRITGSAWWRDYVGARRRRVTVKDGRGRSNAGSYTFQAAITMPHWSRNRFVTLHELAHQATDAARGEETTAAHGPEYAGMLLSLVSRFLGREKAAELRDSYRKHGVKYRLPQKRGSR
jgi:putative metallohydrolase (TIGR04338 family)